MRSKVFGRPWLWIAVALTACDAGDQAQRLVFGTTHTVEDSGVLELLVTAFREDHGGSHRLSVVVAGSGEILALAARGDVDVVLSHAPAAEKALVEAGGARSRRRVMSNHFVLLGPVTDPAGAASASSVAEAFGRIAAASQPFVSRGDDSGTHQRERAVWADAGIVPSWRTYVEAATGMAEALRLASQRDAYILSDRATFEVLRGEVQLVPVHEDSALVNEYSVLISENARHAAGARQLAAWLTDQRAQGLIASYRAPRTGAALFAPASGKSSVDE